MGEHRLLRRQHEIAEDAVNDARQCRIKDGRGTLLSKGQAALKSLSLVNSDFHDSTIKKKHASDSFVDYISYELSKNNYSQATLGWTEWSVSQLKYRPSCTNARK